jgi:NTP pyrophosphatase (non-canonical NTP hydrolase)
MSELGKEQLYEFLSFMAKYNNVQFNVLKTAEEASELAQASLKLLTRLKGMETGRENLIEEIGDLKMRVHMLVESLDISVLDIEERVLSKGRKYLKLLKSKHDGSSEVSSI